MNSVVFTSLLVAAWFTLKTMSQLEPFLSMLFWRITISRRNLRLKKIWEGETGEKVVLNFTTIEMPVFAMPTHTTVGNFRNVSEQSYMKDASVRNTAFQKRKKLCFSALCNQTLWARSPLGGSRFPTAEGSFGSADDGIISSSSWKRLIKQIPSRTEMSCKFITARLNFIGTT